MMTLISHPFAQKLPCSKFVKRWTSLICISRYEYRPSTGVGGNIIHCPMLVLSCTCGDDRSCLEPINVTYGEYGWMMMWYYLHAPETFRTESFAVDSGPVRASGVFDLDSNIKDV